VLEAFNPEKLHKGIKIQSSDSAKVYAAAPGNVVYAGSGLRGYGRLIIIKHSDTLLSAYANNDNLRVEVGDAVTQDDVISNLGSDKVLYFEIRKDGNPVNPVKYLK
jgi:lipoprotein NlpD